MKPWIRLALKEFWLPFHYRKPGCPGGRDFVWLSIFMALLLTLMLLLLASREGLLNRFVDVLLGNIPGHGVPISVTNNMFSQGGRNAIDSSVLAEVNQLHNDIAGLGVYPYRTLESNLYPLVSLPDEQIWKNKRDDGSKFGPDFNGWAIYPEDPLWSINASSTTLPLEVVMSQTLFERYFDYSHYRQVLQGLLPAALWKRMPKVFNDDQLFDQLWLRVKIGDRRDLLPFKVTWTKRFPVIDNIAYLFPLATYHALKNAHHFPELRYFPETYGEGGSRIKQILLEIDQASEKQIIYKKLLSHLNGELLHYRGDLLVTFQHPWPKSWIDAYVKQYDLKYEIMETIAGDTISHQNNMLSVPCGRLPNNWLRDLQFTACAEDMRQPVKIDVTARGNGFHHALVYVPDRRFLSIAVEKLKDVKDQALSIHPSYQDALNRFGFLSKMLDALEKPYAWLLGIFLIAFLGIQIATLIGHHRHRYGVFLAKGMEWWQIYGMLWLQIFMAMVLGMVVALCVITATSILLQSAVKSVAITYADTLSIADLNLLPLSIVDYGLVAIVVLCIVLVLATILLYFLPLRHVLIRQRCCSENIDILGNG